MFLFSTGNLNLRRTNVSFSLCPSVLSSYLLPSFSLSIFLHSFPVTLLRPIINTSVPLSPFPSPRHSFLPHTTLLHYLTDWLTDRQTHWLTDSFTDSLTYMVIPYNVKTNKQPKQISNSSDPTPTYEIQLNQSYFPLHSSPMI